MGVTCMLYAIGGPCTRAFTDLSEARCPQVFQASKVKGYVDLDTCETDEDKFAAIGNDFADRVAKAAALRLPRPSTAEQEDWNQQQVFLKKYLQFIPSALFFWASGQPDPRAQSPP